MNAVSIIFNCLVIYPDYRHAGPISIFNLFAFFSGVEEIYGKYKEIGNRSFQQYMKFKIEQFDKLAKEKEVNVDKMIKKLNHYSLKALTQSQEQVIRSTYK